MLQEARDRLLLTRDIGHCAVRALAAAEGLERIGRGSYLKPDPAWEAWQRARIIHLARMVVAIEKRPDAVACLTSAAVLWDLPVWQNPATVEIWAGRNGWRRAVDLPASGSQAEKETLRRYSYTLGETDRATVKGIPTLTLERTALDVALRWHPRDALVTVDGIFRRIVAPDRREPEGVNARTDVLRAELLDRLAQLGHQRGVVRARAILTYATPWSESPGESVVRWAALALGLPEPTCQWPFARSDGRYFYLDLFWESVKACIEFDGMVKYRGEHPVNVIVAEKKRDDEIRRSGIDVIHLDTKTANNLPTLVGVLHKEVPPELWRGAHPRRGLWTGDLAAWRMRADTGQPARRTA